MNLNLFMILIAGTPIYARHLETGEDINTQLLSTIKSYMNSSANPCENFHNYACGNWMNNNGFPNDLKIANVPSSLEYMYNRELIKMLEDGVKSHKFETKEVFNKLYDFYESCKNRKEINVDRYLVIAKPTEEDDWPRDGESWQPQEKWNIWSTMGKLALFGFNHIFVDFHLGLTEDSRHFVVYLEPYEFNAAQLMFVKNHISHTADPNATAMLEKVVKFMDEVNRLYHKSLDQGVGHVTMGVEEYKEIHEDIYLFISAFKEGHHISAVDLIDVKGPSFLDNLIDLVKATPQDILMHTLKQSFRYYWSLEMPDKNLDIACVEILRKWAPVGVNFVYQEEIYSHEKSKTEAVFNKIFPQLKTKLVSIIQTEHNNMPQEVLESLTRNILQMSLNFGDLLQVIKDIFYVDLLLGWHVAKNDFYHNHLNILEEFSPLQNFSIPAYTTPMYLSISNFMVVPFAYLRYPMFDPDFHEIFLYAEMGNRVAHAMLDAFNFETRHFDRYGDGNLFSRCNGSITELCLDKEYNYKFDDRLAFRLAYDTYFQTMASDLKDFKDNELSQKQLFFIKYAQMFCINPNFIDDQSKDAPTTRLTYVLDNHPEFAEIFSCSTKTDEGDV